MKTGKMKDIEELSIADLQEIAVAKAIRHHYQNQGYEVRIDKNGHVTFRTPGLGKPWKEGRWVSEYRIVKGEVILT